MPFSGRGPAFRGLTGGVAGRSAPVYYGGDLRPQMRANQSALSGLAAIAWTAPALKRRLQVSPSSTALTPAIAINIPVTSGHVSIPYEWTLARAGRIMPTPIRIAKPPVRIEIVRFMASAGEDWTATALRTHVQSAPSRRRFDPALFASINSHF